MHDHSYRLPEVHHPISSFCHRPAILRGLPGASFVQNHSANFATLNLLRVFSVSEHVGKITSYALDELKMGKHG